MTPAEARAKTDAGQWGLSCAPVRHLLVDISPLRDSVAYRRLWFNDLLSAGASQVSVVALPYQVYALTGSSNVPNTCHVGWLIKYLPTRPLEFAKPCGNVGFADNNSRRGDSNAWAASTIRPALISCSLFSASR